MLTIKEMENQYLLIESFPRGMSDPSRSILKLGKIQVQDNSASYLVEVKDWSNNNSTDSPLRDKREFEGNTTAFIGFVALSKAVIITEKEFYTELINHIVKQLAELKNHEDAWMYNYRITEERRALITHLITKTKPGLVII